MRHARHALVIAAVGLIFGAGTLASAQIHAVTVATGFTRPVAMVQDPSQANVQVIAEQGGRVWVMQDGHVLETPFLDLSDQVAQTSDGGLLGFTFAPDYATSGRFYLNFTNLNNNTVIARFTRSSDDPFQADLSTRFDLMWPDGNRFIVQPGGDHNGGNLTFGPDGMLWIALGDGGGEGDPNHRAQDPTTLLGKMLRLDVSVPDDDPQGYVVPGNNPYVGQDGVLAEIWDIGFRNPWRYSFDDPARGGSGALFLADVGENQWEEIDFEPAGSPGGVNYGWSLREGAHDFNPDQPAFSPLTDPFYEYSHGAGTCITGGVVYRGTALGSAYYGRYFFGDFIRGRLWSMGLGFDENTGAPINEGVVEHTTEVGDASKWLVSFGVDASGEMYLVDYVAGVISLVVAGPPPPPPPSPSPPAPTTNDGTCDTADPFVGLGGGSCANGDWFPPGYPVPASTLPPSPAPTPVPTPTPTPGTCSTPDPFADLGGGICANGDWFPPGYPIPGGTPPTPTPTPTPPPPPVSMNDGTCPTPDPFQGIPGLVGQCANGNWTPVPDSGTPPAPTPAPTPTPPPPAPGGCPTPDPFQGIPGLIGVCTNGDWTPVPGVRGPATVQLTMPSGVPVWVLVSDDGVTYTPTNLPTALHVDGQRVSFGGQFTGSVFVPNEVQLIDIAGM